MTKRKDLEPSGSGGEKDRCPVAGCGERLRPGREFHCTGSRVAWQSTSWVVPHHGHTAAKRCWKCGAPMGCNRCAGIVTERLCTHCCVWTNPLAFAHHGPILNDPGLLAKRGGTIAPGLSAYPANFQRAYWDSAGDVTPRRPKPAVEPTQSVGIERGPPPEGDA